MAIGGASPSKRTSSWWTVVLQGGSAPSAPEGHLEEAKAFLLEPDTLLPILAEAPPPKTFCPEGRSRGAGSVALHTNALRSRAGSFRSTWISPQLTPTIVRLKPADTVGTVPAHHRVPIEWQPTARRDHTDQLLLMQASTCGLLNGRRIRAGHEYTLGDERERPRRRQSRRCWAHGRQDRDRPNRRGSRHGCDQGSCRRRRIGWRRGSRLLGPADEVGERRAAAAGGVAHDDRYFGPLATSPAYVAALHQDPVEPLAARHEGDAGGLSRRIAVTSPKPQPC